MPIKTPQVVSPLPLPPNPADRSTFNTRAYPWSEALAPWTDQVNQLGADTLENAQSAQSDASSASSNAGLAAGYASSASTDAGLALGYKDAAYGSQQAAAGSASTASTASGQAVTAKNEAQQWATSLTTVSGGLKGAHGYANDAAQSAAEAAQSASGAIAPSIHAAPSNPAPTDADEIPIVDSTASWSLKKLTWGNLKAAVFAAFKVVATGGSANATLGLGYAATAPTLGGGLEVLRSGVSRLGQDPDVQPEFDLNATGIQHGLGIYYRNPNIGVIGSSFMSSSPAFVGTEYSYNDMKAYVLFGNNSAASGSKLTARYELYHANNLLNIGTTDATARTALNLFADASGVMTNGPGQLSNDMSDFLSSNTFDEMSSKVGGGGEIDFTTIADNATNLTPQPGKSYWLTKTGTAALTTQFACTHAPGKIRTWHVIVSKGAGANDTFIPNFSVSGLTETSVRWSGGGTIKPTISGVSHVMIMFMQIDQNVRATIVDGW